MSEVVGILLAAGAGKRFGANKLLAPLPDGSFVAEAAARALLRALPDSIAVVRPGDETLAGVLTGLGMRVVENPRADQGMGTSLAAGVAASADAGGWLIALADMPWISPDTIAVLADRLRGGAAMVAPAWQGRRGHPVGFSTAWGAALAGLSGDQGARELLAARPDDLLLVPSVDAGVIRDVDRPADLLC